MTSDFCDATSADDANITWAVLLAQWVDLAKSALALPDDAPSQAMKASVSDIIMLQAVWHALQELDKLPTSEQRLGCLRAQWLIDRHESLLRDHWQSLSLPAALAELITDARAALAAAHQHLPQPPPPEVSPPESPELPESS